MQYLGHGYSSQSQLGLSFFQQEFDWDTVYDAKKILQHNFEPYRHEIQEGSEVVEICAQSQGEPKANQTERKGIYQMKKKVVNKINQELDFYANDEDPITASNPWISCVS